uniref:LRRNT domain-containing protein n=1 Tax=Branchiostoma floridae TaxID=7739 RepID=C3Z222_BRAFL|eukprot:XP_002597527.1 hypothetical protein BRAFLDRAFT_78917 [Branchiostoma floridae]
MGPMSVVPVVVALLMTGYGASVSGECPSACTCNSNVVSCENKELKTVPTVPSDTTKLLLDGNGIASLDGLVAQTLPNLKLGLIHCHEETPKLGANIAVSCHEFLEEQEQVSPNTPRLGLF